ncbi:hypothetical protein TBLA_0B07260 [Henningerozyma blattae CBS 6284]|uniref:LNS2/PITP domain-containing protein n=1 Tax=Henningerozyma blattae (strain ATCC 34711 / CBS 6284 / DSM 70876 / NBRC 10599 / NRRL Y-10934 / UCD 77-7) TaxID=1071380 RepID=I2GZJ2_HENB6|nr:hypothetical protein TBLA_0B07260 [Tetrapisispora blattae CBS 6284]CCH59544.1 hypothetical protein TBLA_0B07260 [Tetrapisispora blattae CBS 6284]
MQYVGRAIGSVSKTLSSINPATLSGAIDVIVVEQPDGTLACSPFHVRFGKFRILKPSQKKVEVLVNGQSTNIPMKLAESGEAHFVFETSTDINNIPDDLLASPLLTNINSPPSSPESSNITTLQNGPNDGTSSITNPTNNNVKNKTKNKLEEPSFLDINEDPSEQTSNVLDHSSSTNSLSNDAVHTATVSPTPDQINMFKKKLNKTLTDIHIPSKLDNNGDLLLDMEGYKPDEEMMDFTDEKLKTLIKDELGNNFDISKIVKEDENGNIKIIQPNLDDLENFDINDNSNSDGAFSSNSFNSLYKEDILRDHPQLDHIDNNSNDNDTFEFPKTIDTIAESLNSQYSAEQDDITIGTNDLANTTTSTTTTTATTAATPLMNNVENRSVNDSNNAIKITENNPSSTFNVDQKNISPMNFEPGKNQTPKLAKNYIKTLRLTSDQLMCLNLKYGENDLTFTVDKGKAIVTSKLYVWRWNVPIVISDIDGTITKSDALGHLMNLVGKDWTHVGVANLFSEISKNGYNILYLTARSAGQADSTRNYLNSILQDGVKLPAGPVILSPDRTMAALRREVILKKPEIFKIACLNDIRSLYFESIGERIEYQSNKVDNLDNKNSNSPNENEFNSNNSTESISSVTSQNRAVIKRCLVKRSPYYSLYNPSSKVNNDDMLTPFFAGFGNRITDALSYRTVGVPSSRIFTINPDGEVHMELLELAGYRSSYVHINELVDHFFPPVVTLESDFNFKSPTSFTPGSPVFNTTNINSSMDMGDMSHINLNSPESMHNNSNDDHFNDHPNTFIIGLNQNGITSTTTVDTKPFFRNNQEEKYTDVNFWREPLINIDDLSDLSDECNPDQQDDSGTINNKDTEEVLRLKSSQGENKNKNKNKKKKPESISKKKYADIPKQSSNNSNTPTNKSTQTNTGGGSRAWSWGGGSNRNNKDILEEKSPLNDKTITTAEQATSTPTKEEIGKKIYFNLGSPLSSPKLSFIGNPDSLTETTTISIEHKNSSNHIDGTNTMTSLTEKMNHLSIGSTQPGLATSGISKINVLDDAHYSETDLPILNTDLHQKVTQSNNEEEDDDDEFDEDEFDEDEFDEDDFSD